MPKLFPCREIEIGNQAHDDKEEEIEDNKKKRVNLNALLVQVCNVDFRSSALASTLVMTSMVGVSVLALWERTAAGPMLRVWCDGTFGPYLWETLLGIAREEGGGPVGLDRLLPDVAGFLTAQERGRP